MWRSVGVARRPNVVLQMKYNVLKWGEEEKGQRHGQVGLNCETCFLCIDKMQIRSYLKGKFEKIEKG